MRFGLVQLMVDGVTLETGASAVLRVEAALKSGKEPAPIPLRQTVARIVLGTTRKHKFATLSLATVKELGARLS